MNEDCTFILGFGLSGYRSFGPELQRIGPCRNINLIIGQNNCGKSNILRFIHDRYGDLKDAISGASDWVLKELEKHQSTSSFPTTLSIATRIDEQHRVKWVQKASGRLREDFVDILIDALSSLNPIEKGFWVDGEIPPNGVDAILSRSSIDRIEQMGLGPFFQEFCGVFKGSSRSGDSRLNIVDGIQWILRDIVPRTNCAMIPTLRKAGEAEVDERSFSGADIIHRIARLQNPEHHNQEVRNDFHRIEAFLRDVTGHREARLEVPYTRRTIVVHMNGRSMPLDALGTGIHEVIILAAAATSLHRHVVCIEEPENHLHPLLQKKLLRYLDQNTNNQYFISTHSAHLLDHPGAAIFHVTMTESGSKVELATNDSHKFAICADLGYRASDLLQTNCVIWVEGPSDRIYITEWIRLVDQKLTEGIDYSVMFYGGKLLSHLSPNDSEIDDFISLRRLNRNMVIVMDSDKSSADERPNRTKQRIIDEWNDHPGFAWVTMGREVENYIPWIPLKEVLNDLVPGKKHREPKSPYDRCIGLDADRRSMANKVQVAHKLVEEGRLTLEPLDLEVRVKELVKFIKNANLAESAGIQTD